MEARGNLKQGSNHRFEFGLGDRTGLDVPHQAVTVNDKGGRQAANPVEPHQGTLTIKQNGKHKTILLT